MSRTRVLIQALSTPSKVYTRKQFEECIVVICYSTGTPCLEMTKSNPDLLVGEIKENTAETFH